jgi:hypothetical protein
MASAVMIKRPDIVALIEKAADKITGGNKAELVAIAVRRLLEENARTGSLFGTHTGSVRVRPGVDLTLPILDESMYAKRNRTSRR